MPRKMLSLVLCVMSAWKNSQILFSSTTQEEKAWKFDKSWTKLSAKLKEVLESEELDQTNEQLQQELSACQHFFDNTEMASGRH